MALTYGFYSSINGDRKYNALQFGSIFDGVIHDGIYINIGGQMIVKASGNGMQVNIQTGRAWFNHTWTLNDTIYPLTLPDAEPLLSKYVAVVLEVDESQSIRRNRFTYVAGTPASSPKYPTLTNNQTLHQYALAYVLIRPGVTTITQANIINNVGKSSCPFVTSVAASMNVDALIARWETQWNEWFNDSKTEYNSFKSQYEAFQARFIEFMSSSEGTFDSFMDTKQSEFLSFIDAKDNEFDGALDGMRDDFSSFWEDFKAGMEEYLQTQEVIWENWFSRIRDQLDTDAATRLQAQIDALAYAYVLANRAVLGVTAFHVDNKAVFGAWGSVAGNRVIVARPAI